MSPWPRDNRRNDAAYLEANSYESKNPRDPFLRYRKPNGDFVWWWHTWGFVHHTGHSLIAVPYMAPAPWVWDEAPEVEWLRAASAIGLLAKMPAPWPMMHKMVCWYPSQPVYHAMLPGLNMLDGFVDRLRKQTLTEIDLMAECDKRYPFM